MRTEILQTGHTVVKSLERPSKQSSLLNLQRSPQSLSLSVQDFSGVTYELLSCGCSVSFRAPGDSMRPAISDGERITVRHVSLSDIKRGDIILYRYPGSIVAHRVVRIEKRDSDVPRFILRGDALGAPGEAVEVEQVLGKVESVERGGRSIDLYSRKVKIIRMLRLCASYIKRWARNSLDMRLPRRCAPRNDNMTRDMDRITQNMGQTNEVQGHNDR